MTQTRITDVGHSTPTTSRFVLLTALALALCIAMPALAAGEAWELAVSVQVAAPSMTGN